MCYTVSDIHYNIYTLKRQNKPGCTPANRKIYTTHLLPLIKQSFETDIREITISIIMV